MPCTIFHVLFTIPPRSPLPTKQCAWAHGSWARPAWFKMLPGLGGTSGGRGRVGQRFFCSQNMLFFLPYTNDKKVELQYINWIVLTVSILMRLLYLACSILALLIIPSYYIQFILLLRNSSFFSFWKLLAMTFKLFYLAVSYIFQKHRVHLLSVWHVVQ